MTLRELFTDIAESIRYMGGAYGNIVANDFPEKIKAIPRGDISIVPLDVTENGTYTPQQGEAFGQVNVEVSGGGDSGYKVYLWACCTATDYIYISINDKPSFRFDTEKGYYYGSNWENIGKVETIKFTASSGNHWAEMTSGYDASYSWARWRVHGTTNPWTAIDLNTTLTLTGDIDLEIMSGTCLGKGTLITMADGSKKPIEEIEVGDYVKGYDGKSLKVNRSQKGQKAFGEDRDIWKFEGGYEIITTYRHRFYNMEHQKMMYLNEWNIGEHAYTEEGKQVALIEHIHEDTPCMHFSLWCEEQNYFAGGLLAGNRHTKEIKLTEIDTPQEEKEELND